MEAKLSDATPSSKAKRIDLGTKTRSSKPSLAKKSDWKKKELPEPENEEELTIETWSLEEEKEEEPATPLD